ncbi:MAG: DUF4125 family protein [Lachnospiraceae bacterium]|nr:DUF4125 family protein [Lachnospiraceae bacterium]
MNIEEILQELDTIHPVEAVETFLQEQMEEAEKQGDVHTLISLENEMIGHYRETSQFEKSKEYCKKVLKLIQESNLNGSVAHATTLINVANAYRAAGDLQESLQCFQAVFPLYEGRLEKTDFYYASLYNNLSLLYQEMGDFEKSCEALNQALEIVVLYPEARIELAVTHTNLATSLLALERLDEAEKHLNTAIALFLEDEEKDYHYSAALGTLGQIQYKKGKFEEAADCFAKAMEEVERYMGRTKAYEILEENRRQALAMLETKNDAKVREKDKDTEEGKTEENRAKENISGLTLCEAYYETYGRKMIQEKFPEYEEQIAVGLVGEGSDCFGFDDEISRDHDFGPRFCMWLPDSVYGKIGEALQKEYEKLPKEFMGFEKNPTPQGKDRCRVYRIGEFYEQFIGIDRAPQTIEEWRVIPEENLAAAVNGKIFRDDLGEFTKVREQLLAYYPDRLWRAKLAEHVVKMGQLGQCNYERMCRRQEWVTAEVILGEYMQVTMQTVYLLNRTYAPYYKWLHKGMNKLAVLPEIMDIFNAIADMPRRDERIPMTIEIVASLILAQLKQQKLIPEEPGVGADANYLEKYGVVIMDDKRRKEDLIDALVKEEWEAFDKVENEGGRASCQDDWNTFSIMRKSQYMEWSEEMLQSYLNDFAAAKQKGWNLITEKYGRMMESTTPDHYAKIKDKLPCLSPEKKQIIEEIVKIQVGFMEELAERYPMVAGTARSIHTYEDTPYDTSYETYLRGELGTYSDETLQLYGRFIVSLASKGDNLAMRIMEHTAELYGYTSLDELEERLRDAER